MFKKIHTIPTPLVNIDVLEHDGEKVKSIAELPGYRITATIKKPSPITGRYSDGESFNKDLYFNFSDMRPVTEAQDLKLTFPEDTNLNDEQVKQIEQGKQYIYDTLKYSFELGSLSKTKFGDAALQPKMPSMPKPMLDSLWASIFQPMSTGSKIIFDPDDLSQPPRIVIELGNGVWFYARTSKRPYTKKNPKRIYGTTRLYDRDYVFSFHRESNPNLFKELITTEVLIKEYFERFGVLQARMPGVKFPPAAALVFDQAN